jgi:hypothetical protein
MFTWLKEYFFNKKLDSTASMGEEAEAASNKCPEGYAIKHII